MTIDLDGMKMEFARVYGKEPYTMDQAIYCKLKEHGIETKKAVGLAVSIDKMIRDSFPNCKDTHLTDDEREVI